MTPPWIPGKGPKTKRLAEARLRQLLFHGAHDDDSFLETARRQIPDAWHTLEMDLDVAESKEKMTLYLDRSVARMLRAMGRGYQERVNRILATWVQMKIAEKVVFEKDMLNLLEETAGEASASDDASEMTRRRSALHEHWAYLQGVLDATEHAGTEG